MIISFHLEELIIIMNQESLKKSKYYIMKNDKLFLKTIILKQ